MLLKSILYALTSLTLIVQIILLLMNPKKALGDIQNLSIFHKITLLFVVVLGIYGIYYFATEGFQMEGEM